MSHVATERATQDSPARSRQLARLALARPFSVLRHPIATVRWWRAMRSWDAPKTDDEFVRFVRDTGFEARSRAALAAYDSRSVPTDPER